jgi:hypothetical protein
MKASELRIGNWFKEDMTLGGFSQITAEQILDLYNDPLDDFYQPIPITEELLLRLGFEYHSFDKNYVIKNKDGYCNSIKKNDGEWCYNNDISDANCYFIREVKYIHQLQNLYFALNEEELTIK